MDRRDGVRIGRAESPRPTDSDVTPDESTPPLAASSRRFARLVEHPAARKLALSRVGRAAIGLAIVSALIVVGGSTLSRSVVAWLHRRPEYQSSFASIELDPPVPAWIRMGRAGLLESIRADRTALRSFSVLDLDLEALLADFRLNPWILRADRAEKRHPNGVVVRLAYREPVATVVLADRSTYPVDAEGVVLPRSEMAANRAGPLAEIHAGPTKGEPTPGLSWPGEVPVGRAARPDRVSIAARLAGFFKTKPDLGPRSSTSPPPRRIVLYTNDGNALWVGLPTGTMVCWSRFDATGDPAEATDAEKWDRLEARARSPEGLQPSQPGEYLEFVPGGIRVHRSVSSPIR